jgi:hypothetical protein
MSTVHEIQAIGVATKVTKKLFLLLLTKSKMKMIFRHPRPKVTSQQKKIIQMLEF